jgi:hypothetical protein
VKSFVGILEWEDLERARKVGLENNIHNGLENFQYGIKNHESETHEQHGVCPV